MMATNAVRAGRASTSRIRPRPIANSDRTIEATERKPATTSVGELWRSEVASMEVICGLHLYHATGSGGRQSRHRDRARVDAAADGARRAAIAASLQGEAYRPRRQPLSREASALP